MQRYLFNYMEFVAPQTGPTVSRNAYSKMLHFGKNKLVTSNKACLPLTCLLSPQVQQIRFLLYIWPKKTLHHPNRPANVPDDKPILNLILILTICF